MDRSRAGRLTLSLPRSHGGGGGGGGGSDPVDRADNFNRADGAVGTPSDAGSAWEGSVGIARVVSNRLKGVGSLAIGGNPVVLETHSGDYTVAVDIVTLGTAAGVILNYSDDQNYVFLAFGSAYPVNKFMKVQGGVVSLIEDLEGIGNVVSQGDRVMFQRIDEGLFVSIDGGNSQIGSTFGVAFNKTVTKHGIWIGDLITVFDNFNGTKPPGGGGS